MDRVAAVGFNAAAGAYDAGRPSWPSEAVDAAFTFWGLEPRESLVVDLAAGTGRLTEQLAKRCPRLLAVEPAEEMRRRIRVADAVAGTAEQIPLDDGSAYAVFVGEAFHWFDQPAALRELARVLVPGGGLAIAWNHPLATPEEQPWRDELATLLAEHHYHPKGLALDSGDPREIRDWQAGPQWSRFEPLTYREFAHSQTVTRAAAVAHIASFSYIGGLEAKARQEVLAQVDALLASHRVESYEQRWRCDLYLTCRRARSPG